MRRLLEKNYYFVLRKFLVEDISYTDWQNQDYILILTKNLNRLKHLETYIGKSMHKTEMNILMALSVSLDATFWKDSLNFICLFCIFSSLLR